MCRLQHRRVSEGSTSASRALRVHDTTSHSSTQDNFALKQPASANWHYVKALVQTGPDTLKDAKHRWGSKVRSDVRSG
eukprot:1049822-Amphidinium_carterae.2